MKPSKLSLNKVWKFSLIFLAITFTGLMSLTSCQNLKKPSFIIIAIDRLAFNSFACSDDKSSESSGLSSLCKEALRFTHAYTTSPQPAAALGSLLTGQYPYRHGLHRSFDRVSSKLPFLSEFAEQEGYRTAFFSGSPSIMKKTGLSRGFEIFDDLSFLEKRNYLTDFRNQALAVSSWINESKTPFLSLIYNSELESLNEGETEASRFEKLDEKLSQFFAYLKKENLWETNYIIVLGLKGQSDYNRPKETPFSNLHSENTNITLFIKPPRQKGDDGANWKIDTPVTLADLGFSLMKTFQDNYLTPIDDLFPVWDLSALWKDNNLDLSAFGPRKILIESTNTWKQQIETRFAILYKSLLYIENQSDEVYNTLNDGLETIDISSTATVSQNDFKNENRKMLSDIRTEKKIQKWSEYKSQFAKWITSNRDYWSKPNTRADLFDAEYQRFKTEQTSQPLTALLVQNLISKNRIDLLKDIGLKIDTKKGSYEKEKEAYLEVARRHSLNLSLENIWGLWKNQKNWTQSTFISEYQ
jgi:hypothetical protein